MRDPINGKFPGPRRTKPNVDDKPVRVMRRGATADVEPIRLIDRELPAERPTPSKGEMLAAEIVVGLIPIVGTTKAAIDLQRDFDDLSAPDKVAGIGMAALSAGADLTIVAKPIKAGITAIKGQRVVETLATNRTDTAADVIRLAARQGNPVDEISIRAPSTARGRVAAAEFGAKIARDPELLRSAKRLKVETTADPKSVRDAIDTARRLRQVARTKEPKSLVTQVTKDGEVIKQVLIDQGKPVLRPEVVIQVSQDLPNLAVRRMVQAISRDAKDINITVQRLKDPGRAPGGSTANKLTRGLRESGVKTKRETLTKEPLDETVKIRSRKRVAQLDPDADDVRDIRLDTGGSGGGGGGGGGIAAPPRPKGGGRALEVLRDVEKETKGVIAVSPGSVRIDVDAISDPRPDVTPETTPDVTPDPTPQVPPEPTPRTPPETTPDVTPDPTPQITPEPTPKTPPETTPDERPGRKLDDKKEKQETGAGTKKVVSPGPTGPRPEPVNPDPVLLPEPTPSPVITEPTPEAPPRPAPTLGRGISLGDEPADEPKTAPAVVPEPAPGTPPPPTDPTTRPKPGPRAGKPKPFVRFRLPNGRTLKPGEFPKRVSWVQGVVEIEMDMETGKRRFRATDRQGTPSQTFRVLSVTDEPVPVQRFDLGIQEVIVTDESLSFSRDRVGVERNPFTRRRVMI